MTLFSETLRGVTCLADSGATITTGDLLVFIEPGDVSVYSSLPLVDIAPQDYDAFPYSTWMGVAMNDADGDADFAQRRVKVRFWSDGTLPIKVVQGTYDAGYPFYWDGTMLQDCPTPSQPAASVISIEPIDEVDDYAIHEFLPIKGGGK